MRHGAGLAGDPARKVPLLGVALAVGCAGACAGVRTGPPAPRVEPPADPPPAYVTPARWDYHPATPTAALAAVKLPDGGCAFTAEGGQRWSSATTKQAGGRMICSGKAEASFEVAQEDLTSIIRREGSWVFVGEGGSLYEAGEALGKFSNTVRSTEPLAKVVGVGSGVLGATLEGKLLRWEHDKGWGRASTSPVLAGARIFDLAAGSGTRVLALGFPEALFTSEDGGVTWAAVSAPAVGARRLGATSGGDLGAQGVFESMVWRGASFSRSSERIAGAQATLDVEAGRAPAASAVQGGRAVVDADRYYEVVRPDTEGDLWLLARGRLEGRLETVPLAGSERCASVRLGARGKVVFVACVFTDGGEIAAEIRRSADGATTWGEPLRLATPDTDQINIAVSPDGSAMATGVCRASDATGSCKPSAPLVLRELAADADGGAGDAGPADAATGPADAGSPDAGEDGGAPRVAGLHAFPSSAPQLTGMALNPVFGGDAHTAYFLGRRGKDDRITLFASHDGGETFSPRTLQVVNAPPVRRREGDDDSSEGDVPDTFEIDETSPLRPGDDGAIGMMVTRNRGGPAYVTVDDDGRVLQVAGQPLDDEGNPVDVTFSGHGRRLLAIPNDAGVGAFWESVDGGANWERQAMPQALVREYARAGTPPVICGLAGCLIGETIARVGWGVSGDTSAPDRPPDPGAGSTPSVLTAIVCDLSANTKWTHIEDVFEPERAGPLPTIRDIMRGRSVWSVLSLDTGTGAFTSTSATLPESGEGEARVVRRPLIGPAAPHTATAISATQVEGYAVVRAPYPTDAAGKPKVGAPLRNVEVAWENFFEGIVGHARIPDAGPLDRDDVVQVPGGLDQLETGLISVTPHGFFVRPHRAHARTGTEFFLDTTGRVERYASTPWPSTTALGQVEFRADAAAVGGELLGVGMIKGNDSEWQAAVLAKRGTGGGPWSFAAEGLVPAPASSLIPVTHWAWSAKAPVGMITLIADPGRARAWAHFLGFRPDGTFQPAQPIPTLYDLGEHPRPCSLADRTSTPRAALRFFNGSNNTVLFPGARHPVLVQEPRSKNAVGIAEPLPLITSGVVAHGTPAAPCVAAFQAESATGASIAAVIPGDLSHAWLFRVSADPPRTTGKRAQTAPPGPTLEYRPIACHYDPTARVPEAIWQSAGTSRP